MPNFEKHPHHVVSLQQDTSKKHKIPTRVYHQCYDLFGLWNILPIPWVQNLIWSIRKTDLKAKLFWSGFLVIEWWYDKNTARNCPNSHFFWSVFSRIRTKYAYFLRKFPNSIKIRENTLKNLKIQTLIMLWYRLEYFVFELALYRFNILKTSIWRYTSIKVSGSINKRDRAVTITR